MQTNGWPDGQPDTLALIRRPACCVEAHIPDKIESSLPLRENQAFVHIRAAFAAPNLSPADTPGEPGWVMPHPYDVRDVSWMYVVLQGGYSARVTRTGWRVRVPSPSGTYAASAAAGLALGDGDGVAEGRRRARISVASEPLVVTAGAVVRAPAFNSSFAVASSAAAKASDFGRAARGALPYARHPSAASRRTNDFHRWDWEKLCMIFHAVAGSAPHWPTLEKNEDVVIRTSSCELEGSPASLLNRAKYGSNQRSANEFIRIIDAFTLYTAAMNPQDLLLPFDTFLHLFIGELNDIPQDADCMPVIRRMSNILMYAMPLIVLNLNDDDDLARARDTIRTRAWAYSGDSPGASVVTAYQQVRMYLVPAGPVALDTAFPKRARAPTLSRDVRTPASQALPPELAVSDISYYIGRGRDETEGWDKAEEEEGDVDDVNAGDAEAGDTKASEAEVRDVKATGRARGGTWRARTRRSRWWATRVEEVGRVEAGETQQDEEEEGDMEVREAEEARRRAESSAGVGNGEEGSGEVDAGVKAGGRPDGRSWRGGVGIGSAGERSGGLTKMRAASARWAKDGMEVEVEVEGGGGGRG
ncbi:uncharacterized protein BXZ73DRAFT_83016 [Epithele typhae]|uniref:uncharacterized protein n=1 Tax=Epithele typhae TaxID=378194 RepID=UPI00200899F0|nr:uncharacterized protein BXZ73DRAFT_83016 [Epithele typhae]KAH9911016.1 hypothetical protein BXZ73DRAFT_83016 [Epithele typhae]